MAEIRSGMRRNCTVDGCDGQMRAGTEMQVDGMPKRHTWMCTTNHEHVETPRDAEIPEEDILPPN